MLAKELKYGNTAREAMKNGVDKLANAVKVTLGPKGKYVVLTRPIGSPIVTNDGVTIAKEFILKDKYENAGAQLIKEASVSANDVAGDGSSTTTVLVQALLNAGIDAMNTTNANTIKAQMNDAMAVAIDYLNSHAKEVKDEGIEQIATISASDESIGKLVADAVTKVGRDGILTLEQNTISDDTYVKVIEGMQFDRGWGASSPYFVNDLERSECSFDRAKILLTNLKLNNILDIRTLLEDSLKTGMPLVIVADDIDPIALAQLIQNKSKIGLKVNYIKAPGYGSKKKDILENLAVVTGAKFISDDLGKSLSEVTVDDLGEVKKIVSTKYSTTIFPTDRSEAEVKVRINQLKAQLDDTESKFDKTRIKEQLAQLSKGVGVIYIGASTDAEMKAKRYKIEDAINATKAAIEEGVVVGGGRVLFGCSQALRKHADADKPGFKIVADALEVPMRQILENAGVVVDAAINETIMEANNENFGYDAKEDTMCDLVKAGVIDPVKVTKAALTNAVSIAGLILTTEAVMIDDVPLVENKEVTL